MNNPILYRAAKRIGVRDDKLIGYFVADSDAMPMRYPMRGYRITRWFQHIHVGFCYDLSIAVWLERVTNGMPVLTDADQAKIKNFLHEEITAALDYRDEWRSEKQKRTTLQNNPQSVDTFIRTGMRWIHRARLQVRSFQRAEV